MAEDPEKVLTNRWIHSHEEDTPAEMVFRNASFDFPRSRGRSGFELRPDRSMVEIQPGAADEGEETKESGNCGRTMILFSSSRARRSRRAL